MHFENKSTYSATKSVYKRVLRGNINKSKHINNICTGSQKPGLVNHIDQT